MTDRSRKSEPSRDPNHNKKLERQPQEPQRKNRQTREGEQLQRQSTEPRPSKTRRRIFLIGAGTVSALGVGLYLSQDGGNERELVGEGRVTEDTDQISVDAQEGQQIYIKIDGPYASSREGDDPLPSTALVRIHGTDETALEEGMITAPGEAKYNVPQSATYTVEVKTVNAIDAPRGRDPVQTVDYQIYVS